MFRTMFRDYKRDPFCAALVLGFVFFLLFAIGAGLIASAADGSAAPPHVQIAPRAVGLFDAERPPTYLVYLYPRGSVTLADAHGYNCKRGGYFTDTSAYTWRGGSLGRQHSSDTLQWWRSQDGGRVTFDGVTFRNRTPSPVLVAGWCDAGALHLAQ
jgi:hypothetical protein